MSDSENQTFSSAFPEKIKPVRYDLEHEDVRLSARLVDAAANGNWTQVQHLLADGADPRICRYIDGVRYESALYFALKAKEFNIADALYRAGDRLDDLCVGDTDTLSGDAVNFLVRAEARGDHVFLDEEKPLSECIRCGLWAQAHEAVKSAPRIELNLSVEMICLYLEPWNAVEYLRILDELKVRGANFELIGTIQEEIIPAISSLTPALQAEFMKRIGDYIAE